MKQTFGALLQSMQCCEYLFYCDYISPAAALNTKRGEGEEEKDKRNITRGYHQTMEGASESMEWGWDWGKPITLPVISVWWIDAPLVFCATMHLCLLLSFEPVSVYRPNVLSCIVEIYRSSHLCNALRLIIAQFLLLNSGQKWRIWRPKKTVLHNLIPFLIRSQRFLEEHYQSHRHDIRTYLMSALGFSANVESR